MALSMTQRQFVNAVAELGTPKLACDRLKVGYNEYKTWQDSAEFYKEVLEAKQFFREGIEETISVLAKRKLLEIMLNGVMEVSTTLKSIVDFEGNVTGQERTVKKTHKGVPSWAIREGLALIPDIQQIMLARAAYNAISPEEIEQVKAATQIYEKELRLIASGKETNSAISEDIISGIQRTLVGGG